MFRSKGVSFFGAGYLFRPTFVLNVAGSMAFVMWLRDMWNDPEKALTGSIFLPVAAGLFGLPRLCSANREQLVYKEWNGGDNDHLRDLYTGQIKKLLTGNKKVRFENSIDNINRIVEHIADPQNRHNPALLKALYDKLNNNDVHLGFLAGKMDEIINHLRNQTGVEPARSIACGRST